MESGEKTGECLGQMRNRGGGAVFAGRRGRRLRVGVPGAKAGWAGLRVKSEEWRVERGGGAGFAADKNVRREGGMCVTNPACAGQGQRGTGGACPAPTEGGVFFTNRKPCGRQPFPVQPPLLHRIAKKSAGSA